MAHATDNRHMASEDILPRLQLYLPRNFRRAIWAMFSRLSIAAGTKQHLQTASSKPFIHWAVPHFGLRHRFASTTRDF